MNNSSCKAIFRLQMQTILTLQASSVKCSQQTTRIGLQGGVVVRRVGFTTVMIVRLTVQLHPSLVVESLVNMLHDNYLVLVESNKQQIKEARSRTQSENLETKQFLSIPGFVLCMALRSL